MSKRKSKFKQRQYRLITIGVCLLWIITIPLWYLYYRFCNQLDNAYEVFLITIQLIPFYMAYAFSVIPDSIFIGMGKTKYNAINSFIINMGYYGLFYILYRIGILTMTMHMIILMFGLGMLVHLVISIIQEKMYFKSIGVIEKTPQAF